MSDRFIICRMAAAALLGAGSASVHAAPTPPVETTARTVLLHPATVLKLDDLDFGSVVATSAGTIVLDPVSGAVSATGGVLPVAGTPHAAHFVGAASRNTVVIIKIPKQPVTLTRVAGTETMTLTAMTLDSPDKRTMANSTSFEFKVGGTANIAAGQAEGMYVGTFTVTVQYP